MVKLNQQERILFFNGRKRFGWRSIDKSGERTYEEAQLANPYAGFYRIRKINGKKVYDRLKFYKPTNPQTESQQAWRGVFATGIEAWYALPDDQKRIWKMRGNKKQMTGKNAFMSDYLTTHRL